MAFEILTNDYPGLAGIADMTDEIIELSGFQGIPSGLYRVTGQTGDDHEATINLEPVDSA